MYINSLCLYCYVFLGVNILRHCTIQYDMHTCNIYIAPNKCLYEYDRIVFVYITRL